jgi:hypothetical protein
VRERLPTEEEISLRILVLLGTESSHKIPNLKDSPLLAKKIWYPISQKLKKKEKKRDSSISLRNNPFFMLDQRSSGVVVAFIYVIKGWGMEFAAINKLESDGSV